MKNLKKFRFTLIAAQAAGCGRWRPRLASLLGLLVGLPISPQSLQVNLPKALVYEGTPDSRAKFSVTRVGPVGEALSIRYATLSTNGLGWATAGKDYVPTNGVLNFAPDQTIAYFSVQVLDDGDVEDPSEAVQIQFTDAKTASGSPLRITAPNGSSAKLWEFWIRDNEAPATLDVRSFPAPPLHFAGTRDTSNPPTWQPILLRSGGALIHGDFTEVNGEPRLGLAKLRPDGDLDLTFAPTGDYRESGFALELQSGGLILGNGTILNRDGSRRGQINPDDFQVEYGFQFVWAESSDGRLQHWSENNGNLVRVDYSPTGNLQASTLVASPGTNMVLLSVQPTGKLLILERQPSADRVIRLLADGQKDSAFTPVEQSGQLILNEDGSFFAYVAGAFRRYDPDGILDPSYPAFISGACGDSKTGLRINGNRIVGDGSACSVNGIPAGYSREGMGLSIYTANPPATSLAIFSGRRRGDVESWSGSTSDYEFVGSPFEFGEPDPSERWVTFRRLGSTTKPASISYSTRDVTAQAGRDYEPQAGTLTFAPLETERAIRIPFPEGEVGGAFEVAVTGGSGFEVLPSPLRIVAGPGDFRARITRTRRLESGAMILEVVSSGQLGREFWVGIEVSDDLKIWRPLGDTHQARSTGSAESPATFLDNPPTGASARYYRALTH